LTVLMGMANPMPDEKPERVKMAVLIPTTLPAESNSGPLCPARATRVSEKTKRFGAHAARGRARPPCRRFKEPILLLPWVCLRGGGVPSLLRR
jgi:hypothetical protein